MTNPTPTPSADIHAANIQVPKCRCAIGDKGSSAGEVRGNHHAPVCPMYEVQSEPREQIAALQSEIAQLRADIATATANAAKAQDTINGQARKIEAAQEAVKIVDRIVDCYRLRPVDVAYVLDEFVDRSGNLLGWVREATRSAAEAALSPAKQGDTPQGEKKQ